MTESGTMALDIVGYSDVERIGQGGVGVVYRATRSSTGGTVAIKVLRDVSDESVVWHRTRRELTALVALAGHANVIQLVEQVEVDHGGDRVPALVMEYAPGGSVADLMSRRGGVMTVGEAVLIGEHIAAALVAAHAQGIVHRDIKPQNLLIDAFGQVKLCDFGIASLTRTEGFETRTRAWSMRYASPEDLDDNVEVGPPSDVYSLGATLLHLVHGAPPTLKQRLAEWVPPHTEHQQLAALDVVLAECLHPSPARRPTAPDLLERLEQLGWTLDGRRRSLAVEPCLVDDANQADQADRLDQSEGVRIESDRDDTNKMAREPAGSMVEATTDMGSSDPSPTSLPFAPAWSEFDTSSVSGTDETLLRGQRRPPTRPEAVSTARRRWPVVITGAAVLAVVCIATIVLWPSRSSEPARPVDIAAPSSVSVAATVPPVSAGVSARPEPTPTPAIDSHPQIEVDAVKTAPVQVVEPGPRFTIEDRPVGLTDIADGQIVWPFGDLGECLVQVDAELELQPVSCDEAHDLQRISVDELDAAVFPLDADFDQAAVQAAVDLACHAAAEAFVGSPLAQTGLDVPVTRPSAGTWRLGDRRYQCLLGVTDQRIVGDIGIRVG